jgi:hypothetical protein
MIEAKGRNGYFKVNTIEVWKITDGGMSIELYSKHSAKNSPVRIEGSGEEIQILIEALSNAVKTAKPGMTRISGISEGVIQIE